MAVDRNRLTALRRMRASLQEFGAACLKIKTKKKKIISFVMNTAQIYTHNILEEQLRRTGKVRVLILKGRQQGLSTYVAARFYHKSSMWSATNVYILSHEQTATDNLFNMVDRYHEHNPLAPVTGASNAKELEFEHLDSSYSVATANKKAGGRGKTPHLFHGSEVAFWANAADHFASSVQGIPDEPGTEIILESTANGPSGEFYERWQDAEAGKSDYIPIFIPWYWQEEYERNPYVDPITGEPCDFELNDTAEQGQMSEVEYSEMFDKENGGLSLHKMAWRRAKMSELRSYNTFNQEYPATAQMAFVNSNTKSYINGLSILRARKRDIEGAGPLICGADPAGPGGDRFAIAWRRGHEVEKIEWRNKVETAEAYQWCKKIILEDKPARFNVDAGGIGAAVISLLRGDDDIPKGVLRAVNFGTTSQAKKANPKKPGPKNRRAEMWMRSKEWLEDKDEPVSIPDLDVLQADATGCQLKSNLTNDIQLESKEDMRARGVRSPDLWDAVGLTFASAGHIKNYVDKEKPKQQYGNVDVRLREEQKVAPNVPIGPYGWMS